MTINEAFPYDADNMQAGGTGNSDQIQIRTAAGGYQTYRLRENEQWCLTSTTPATTPVPAGTAAWYLSRKNPTIANPLQITVVGQVAHDATRTNSIVANGFSLIANPYPVDIPLNKDANGFGIGFQAGMTEGGQNASDQIQIRDPDGSYRTYRLRANSPTPEWCLTGTTATGDSLPAGASAWYMSRGAVDFKLVFENPVE
jgi:hypothetical protein